MSSAQPSMQLRSPYLRLMRLHQPIGIWLVYWPCVWALALAAMHRHAQTGEQLGAYVLGYMALFLLGAVVMRSAGCIINDMADREFDKHVARTKHRPLASNELSMRQAAMLLVLLGFAGLGVLIALLATLPAHVSPSYLLTAALPVIALIIAYPFMKRITWWPQAFLGITFNWGVIISWIALYGSLAWPALLLYLACFFWTLGYDTVYGHQDKSDDIRIGVKSTSLRLNKNGKLWIGGFYLGMAVFYGVATALTPGTGWSYPDIAGLLIIVAYSGFQLWRVDLDQPASCLRMFKSNALLGLLLGAWLLVSLGIGFS